jgi:hypothetical protein
MFPAAAAANRSIFYDKHGNARTVSDVYAVISARYASAAGAPATQTALAAYGAPAAGTSSVVRTASAAGTTQATPALDSASFLSQLPDVSKAAPVPAASRSDASEHKQAADPIFRSLFQVDDRSQPVSSTVHQLWGRSASLTSDVVTPAASSDTPRPLDLFSDRDGTFSS